MTGIIGGEYGLGWVRRQVIITTIAPIVKTEQEISCVSAISLIPKLNSG